MKITTAAFIATVTVSGIYTAAVAPTLIAPYTAPIQHTCAQAMRNQYQAQGLPNTKSDAQSSQTWHYATGTVTFSSNKGRCGVVVA